MSNLISVDDDTVNFLPTYGAAIMVPIPTTIADTGEKTEVTGKPACLQGDWANVGSAGCMHIAPPFVIPGAGTLQIDKLNSDQLTEKTDVEGKKVILQGSKFDAVFEVQSPAQFITSAGSPQPDSNKVLWWQGIVCTVEYQGDGEMSSDTLDVSPQKGLCFEPSAHYVEEAKLTTVGVS